MASETQELDREIADLTHQVKQAASILTKLKEELRRKSLDRIKIIHGVTEGDVIEWEDNGKLRQILVDTVDFMEKRVWRLGGVLRKADGTWGKQRRTIYSEDKWRVVGQAEWRTMR